MSISVLEQSFQVNVFPTEAPSSSLPYFRTYFELYIRIPTYIPTLTSPLSPQTPPSERLTVRVPTLSFTIDPLLTSFRTSAVHTSIECSSGAFGYMSDLFISEPPSTGNASPMAQFLTQLSFLQLDETFICNGQIKWHAAANIPLALVFHLWDSTSESSLYQWTIKRDITITPGKLGSLNYMFGLYTQEEEQQQQQSMLITSATPTCDAMATSSCAVALPSTTVHTIQWNAVVKSLHANSNVVVLRPYSAFSTHFDINDPPTCTINNLPVSLSIFSIPSNITTSSSSLSNTDTIILTDSDDDDVVPSPFSLIMLTLNVSTMPNMNDSSNPYFFPVGIPLQLSCLTHSTIQIARKSAVQYGIGIQSYFLEQSQIDRIQTYYDEQIVAQGNVERLTPPLVLWESWNWLENAPILNFLRFRILDGAATSATTLQASIRTELALAWSFWTGPFPYSSKWSVASVIDSSLYSSPLSLAEFYSDDKDMSSSLSSSSSSSSSSSTTLFKAKSSTRYDSHYHVLHTLTSANSPHLAVTQSDILEVVAFFGTMYNHAKLRYVLAFEPMETAPAATTWFSCHGTLDVASKQSKTYTFSHLSIAECVSTLDQSHYKPLYFFHVHIFTHVNANGAQPPFDPQSYPFPFPLEITLQQQFARTTASLTASPNSQPDHQTHVLSIPQDNLGIVTPHDDNDDIRLQAATTSYIARNSSLVRHATVFPAIAAPLSYYPLIRTSTTDRTVHTERYSQLAFSWNITIMSITTPLESVGLMMNDLLFHFGGNTTTCVVNGRDSVPLQTSVTGSNTMLWFHGPFAHNANSGPIVISCPDMYLSNSSRVYRTENYLSYAPMGFYGIPQQAQLSRFLDNLEGLSNSVPTDLTNRLVYVYKHYFPFMSTPDDYTPPLIPTYFDPNALGSLVMSSGNIAFPNNHFTHYVSFITAVLVVLVLIVLGFIFYFRRKQHDFRKQALLGYTDVYDESIQQYL